MSSLFLVALSATALASSPSLSTSARPTRGATSIGTIPTADTGTGASTWTVGVEDSPQDLVYSQSHLWGLGLTDEQTQENPLTTGSASASTSLDDDGQSGSKSWEKSSDAHHSASWTFRDRRSRGVQWTYTGSAGHTAEASLDAPDCEVEPGEVPELGCMVGVDSLGMSGIMSSAPDTAGGLGSTGGFGGSDDGGGTDEEDDTTFLVVDETTDFTLVASFHASVSVHTEGLGIGGHSSAFSVSLVDRGTGLTVLDDANQPISPAWSFSSEESGLLRESVRVTFTLEPGEYALNMSIADDTHSYAGADPAENYSLAEVGSTVRAQVYLNSY